MRAGSRFPVTRGALSQPEPLRSAPRGAWRVFPLLVAVSVALAVPGIAAAAPGWTISRTPSTIDQNVTTDVLIKVKNTGGQDPTDPIGCVRISIQDTFTLGTPTVVFTSNGRTWLASVTAGSPTHTLTMQGAQGSDRLRGGTDREEVHVSVPVTGTVLGDFDWTAVVYGGQNCSSSLNMDRTLGMSVVVPGGAGTNTAPAATADGYATLEDTAVSDGAPGVLANDTDPDGDPLAATLVSAPTNAASFALNADGSFSYTPAADFAGTDSFTYRASDGSLASSDVTVTITTTAVNDAPVADADAYAATEDQTLSVAAVGGVLDGDTDVEGDPLTAELVSEPANATSFTLNADGSFSYTPAADFAGTDSFTYRAFDGSVPSAPAAVDITVSSVNDGPLAADDAYASDEDLILTVPAGSGVLANDADPDADPLTASLRSTTSKGLLTFDPDGSFTYVPILNFVGTDSFTYRVSDGSLVSLDATVTIVVGAVNDPPTAAADAYATSEDEALSVAPGAGVLADDTDADGDPLTAELVSGPANASSFTLNPDGSFSYVPASDWSGTDTFSYRASDGSASSAPADVEVTVSPVDDAPTAVDDAYATDEDVLLSVPGIAGVLANDSDPEDDPLVALLVTAPSKGTLTLSPAGSFAYLPPADFNGQVTFTYRVNAGGVFSAPASVTIDVTSVNDAPTAVSDAAVVPAATTIEIDVLSNDTDVDADALSIEAVTQPSAGSATVVGTRIRYAPPSGFVGVATLSYTLTDGSLDDSATVTVTVQPPPIGAASPAPAPTATASPSASPAPASVPGGSATSTPSETPTPSTPSSTDPSEAPEPVSPGPPSESSPPPVDDGELIPLTSAELTAGAATQATGFSGFEGLFTGFSSGFSWAVPAAILGLPGLLFMIAVGGQLLGAAVWVPAVRRYLGGIGLGRRRGEQIAT